MNRPERRPHPDFESLVILVLTLFGAILRIMAFGRLGIDHFDEGIYASAGAWIFRPGGLSAIDPGLIAYAPPGYPVLVGLAYALFGATDTTAILVSILAGVATIPLVGWLARRWFGPDVGAAAAVFAAFSGPHIVFSRMALTDATFLLIWIAAIAAGAAFLDRPGPVRAVVMGIGVGLAQLTKYNGWLVGAVVIVAAVAGLIFVPPDRERGRIARTFGWGIFGAIVALAIDWPWISFVEHNGGYAALLTHQRGYLGHVSDWPRHLIAQLRQVSVLSGGVVWIGLTSASALYLAMTKLAPRGFPRGKAVAAGVIVVLLAFFPSSAGWWLGIAIVPLLLRRPSAGMRTVGAWWLVLTILTPMYHPYARLWLPMEAVGWFLRAYFLIQAVRFAYGVDGDAGSARVTRATAVLAVAALLAAATTTIFSPRPFSPFDLNGPRDSFRIATARIVAKVPGGIGSVCVLGRPTVSYYAEGPLAAKGVGTTREASFDTFLRPGLDWGIIDTAQLRQEKDYDAAMARLLDRCEVIADEHHTLSPATRLDVALGSYGKSDRPDESLLLVRARSGARP